MANYFNSFYNTVAGYFSSKETNVAKALVKLHGQDEGKITNLTAAEDLLQDLKFDRFNENITCKVARGIALAHYPIFVENFAQRFSLPPDIKMSLLEGQYAEDMKEMVLNFDFRKGETGSYIYGRFATLKHDDKIDLAYTVYTLEFKISPVPKMHQKEENFLLFFSRKKIWYEDQELEFSTKEEDYLKNFFMMKAIKGFRSACAGEIEG